MTLIKRINISNFGSYNNFEWKKFVKNNKNEVIDFNKVNIFYGRNYSGKTTLSRIFRAVETGYVPENYNSPSFEIEIDSGKIRQNQIPQLDSNIRVYNKDFIDENLAFLKDSSGQITPFAIIGGDNTLIEKEIDEKTQILGDVENKTGLRYSSFLKNTEYSNKKNQINDVTSELTKKLSNKATKKPYGIKHQSIYKDPNYNIRSIGSDIQTIKASGFNLLTDKEVKKKEGLLKDGELTTVSARFNFNSKIELLTRQARKLLEVKITPTEPIKELLDDYLLQAWVKEGQNYHKGKRDFCGFCGNKLPTDIWKKLDQHFSQESEQLISKLDNLITDCNTELLLLDNLVKVNKKSLYSEFHDEFDREVDLFNKQLKKYSTEIKKISQHLKARKDNIFQPQELPLINDPSSAINTIILNLNHLIESSNQKTSTLVKDQLNARNALRTNEIFKFILDINYDSEQAKITGLKSELHDLKTDVDEITQKIKYLETDIINLNAKLKDEKKGAEKVNEYLNHYFGHDSLQLEAVEESAGSNYKLQITRGEKLAYNLSEGECSLVAFCYFMAKLEDENSKNKKLTIYIDDPISSLDNNHIFFVYSLIENLIAKPICNDNDEKTYKYEQLFISTHNLDFLKYLKKLSKPKKGLEQFLISGKIGGSEICLMPNYLRNYITEFNYLFGEIYICSDPSNAADSHNSFYNFGNNMRKFLEAFLFFKYPFAVNDSRDHNQRIEKFFGDDLGMEPLVQRLINEFSHLAGMFDRSVQPVDHSEISKLAKFVLQKMKNNDSEQFKCLLESINKPDPFIIVEEAN